MNSGIHCQSEHGDARWYAWCECGVCGPLRTSLATADDDAGAHASVCSAGES